MKPLINFIVGETFSYVEGKVGGAVLRFHPNSNTQFELFHDPDCCESIRIEEIIGDLKDLELSPIIEAEEVSSEGAPEPKELDEDKSGSYTWTFYRFATAKGTVVVRWLGLSNGCYSEKVSMSLTQSQRK